MKKIIPITELRNTNEISKMCNEFKEPIYITKNGYADLVIMSSKTYEDFEQKQVHFKKKKYQNELVLENQDDPLGFIKVASVNFKVKISHVTHNSEQIILKAKEAYNKEAKIIVFPELSLTGYSCGELFLSSSLLNNTLKGISKIEKETKDIDALLIFGAPLVHNDKLYNTAICMHKGKILGVIPKSNIPEYGEFYEKRYFSSFNEDNSSIVINNKTYPFGTKILFQNTRYLKEIVGIEICEDLWVNIPPSSLQALNGATICCNLSASNETLNKNELRTKLIEAHCYRNNIGYIYTSSSYYESSSEGIFSGHNIICEPEGIIKQSELFDESLIISEIDVESLLSKRISRNSTSKISQDFQIIPFSCKVEYPTLTRTYNKYPFIDEDKEKSSSNVKKAQLMQAKALIRRLNQINCKDVVIGISGGLDSTIALLGVIKAFDIMGITRKNIHAITMPCFGTTSRTKDNATILCEKLGVNIIEINIQDSVKQHLKDIDISLEDRSVTYENAQARERTQILMDYSNKVNGIVIGTGDLSEIALGWSTYNGDHMSMYNINCSLTKTFLQEMIKVLSNEYIEVNDILLDILGTPVSPELLPPKEGEITQITEDLVGPYMLHDFFLYHYIYKHQSIKKVFELAKITFKNDYKIETIKKWFTHFIKRFYNNQFKRSCSPDGPKISSVSLSPRSDFRLPSDVSGYDFLNELE